MTDRETASSRPVRHPEAIQGFLGDSARRLFATTAANSVKHAVLSSLAVPLVLMGGWMTGYPGGLIYGPLVVAAGLIGGGLTAYGIHATRPLVHAGTVIALLLLLGAAGQYVAGNAGYPVAIGFAAAIMLCVLSSALMRPVLERGMVALRWIGMGSAAFMAAQVLFTPAWRGVGFFHLNPNATGGFITVIAVHWLLSGAGKRGAVLIGLMCSGILFAGSRWALLVLVGALVLLAVMRRVKPVNVAIILAIMVVTMGAFWPQTSRALRITGSSPAAVESTISKGALSALVRTGMDVTPGLMPRGFIGNQAGDGLHVAAMRVAVEAGVLGGLLWLLTALWAVRGASFRSKYVLGVLMTLGIMDYYIWGPFQLAPLWWMVLGIAVQERRQAKEQL